MQHGYLKNMGARHPYYIKIEIWDQEAVPKTKILGNEHTSRLIKWELTLVIPPFNSPMSQF